METTKRIFQNLNTILDTFSSHRGVIEIEEKANKYVFRFRHVLPWKIYRAILSVNHLNQTVAQFQQKS